MEFYFGFLWGFSTDSHSVKILDFKTVKTATMQILSRATFQHYILGFAIGYGSHRSNTDSNNDGIIASALQLQQPNYIFLNNNTGSCPALIGDRLLTTMKEGDSFEGKV